MADKVRLADLRYKRQLGTASSAELRELKLLEGENPTKATVPQESSDNVFVPLSARRHVSQAEGDVEPQTTRRETTTTTKKSGGKKSGKK